MRNYHVYLKRQHGETTYVAAAQAEDEREAARIVLIKNSGLSRHGVGDGDIAVIVQNESDGEHIVWVLPIKVGGITIGEETDF